MARKQDGTGPAPISPSLPIERPVKALRADKVAYTTKELSRELGINPATLNRYAKYGLIACRQLGKHRVYSRADVLDFLTYTEGMTISNTNEGIALAASRVNAARERARKNLRSWKQ